MKYPKKEDREAREHILLAAKKEFAARGFQGARMATIAETAGVNKALIHYYFDNKESLYMEILERMIGLAKTDYDIPLYMDKIDLSSPQKMYILTYLLIMSHLRASDREGNDIMLWEVAEGGKFLKMINEASLAPRQKAVLKLISEGVEKGEFETKHPTLVLQGLFAMAISFQIEIERKFKPTLFEMHGNISEEDYLSFYLEYIFKMLCPRGRSLDIPEVPQEILRYIDRLIDIMKHEGISEKMVDAMMELIIGK
ncbi:MAG: hypothetical protein CVV44_07230 [Spirochaetae bacterium HGW-Spirochaetae-1]|jgi:AcrR family transcriptional regulator|nr:MAG: hypothetical protein CVV44_07230 [Spirochaetae bacterium HGW-Spirochaetae-1]